MLEICKSFWKW